MTFVTIEFQMFIGP